MIDNEGLRGLINAYGHSLQNGQTQIFSLLLLVGIIILWNQHKIKKQIRKIQEQLEQKDKPE